ncbi:MAG: glycosyltransferase [Planctomycetota bacterium]
MKLLFVHDNRFIEHEGDHLTVGNITSTTWKRFLPHVEHIHVVARRNEPDPKLDIGRLNQASHPRVSFELVDRPPYHRFEQGWRTAYPILEANIKKADAVVGRIPSFLGNLACEIAAKQGKPVAGEIIACPWGSMWHYGGMKGKVMAAREYIRLRRLIKRLDLAVYVTSEYLQKRYPTQSKTAVASNVELLRPPEGLLEARLERQKTPPKPLRLGQIGSLANHIKGWETGVEATAELKAAGVEVVYEILGAGDPEIARSYAAKFGVENEVRPIGTIAGGGPVLEWLDTLDLYIHPSRQEGLPRSVIEAMSRALPCVCTPAGGTPELIDSNCLFEKNNPKQLAQRVQTMLGDPALLHEQSRTNFERAANFYIDHLEAHRDKVWGDYFASVRKRLGMPG